MNPSNPSQQPILVFDMDGVLVDVTESYRETIARTVEHFTGRAITREAIQEYKNEGGWSDDWQLSHHIVHTAGVAAPFEEVKTHFQKLFRGGNGTAGLMLRERWIARPGVLEKLSRQFRFALFTGRPKEEAQLTLSRFASHLVFDPIVAMEDVENPKPAPDGLLQIVAQALLPAASALVPTPGVETSLDTAGKSACATASIFYIGDTIDDARAASAANVPFIGIAAPDTPLHAGLVSLFQSEGAHAILPDINYLPEVFAQ
ncbi:MAG: HAD hydrolase-like protein [Bryobacteraceae bacterium]